MQKLAHAAHYLNMGALDLFEKDEDGELTEKAFRASAIENRAEIIAAELEKQRGRMKS